MIASAPTSAVAANPNRLTLPADPALAVILRASENGPCLATEPVSAADLSNPISETWLHACLRRGFPNLALADVPMRLVPLLKRNSNSDCLGYALEVELPNGTRPRREFTARSLASVATRIAQGLIARELLAKGQDYYFELVLQDGPAAPPAVREMPPPVCSVNVTTPPLQYRHIPFRPLLEKADAVGPVAAETFPAFYTRHALAQAEQCSRRGAQATPAVETGGVLVGSLAFCPDAREFFLIVADVLEVQEAVQEEFALTYSNQSWLLIDRVLRARRQAHPEIIERQVGQCHGHSFLPNGGKTCDACPTRAVCDLTSVWASSHDKTWMNAVYARQPWALCQIFGLTARGEPVSKLYSLSDGRWLPRGYHVLPEPPAELSHD